MKKLVLLLMLCAPLATFAQKFGHVDAASIMQSLPEFIKVRGELEALQKEYENDLKAMQDEIQRKAEDYDKNKSTMNTTKQEETEAELNDMYQKLQQAYSDNQQNFQKAQQEKLQPINDKIMQAIKNVGVAGGYVYIMDISAGIPYISETLSVDVTNDVKAEMNKLK
ncbi:MAG: OmpH family outer membrane protein [Prevotella sp.]|nr:OmpH family outer membrane protein [Prevotella sp.]